MTDQGYKNHETMLIAMDIKNDNGLQYANYWRNKARECIERNSQHTDYNPEARLATVLQCHYEQKEEDCVRITNKSTALPTGVFSCLLSSALNRVDWMEIAKELIYDVTELNPRPAK